MSNNAQYTTCPCCDRELEGEDLVSIGDMECAGKKLEMFNCCHCDTTISFPVGGFENE